MVRSHRAAREPVAHRAPCAQTRNHPKEAFRAIERDEPGIAELRENFEAWQETANLDDLVFLDEAGATAAMARTQGRALKGVRVKDKIPRNRGRVTTLIGAMTSTEVIAMIAIESGTNAEVFMAFAKEVRLPKLKRGMTVVQDNLGAHRCTEVRAVFEEAGVHLKFMSPYSPELNPIE